MMLLVNTILNTISYLNSLVSDFDSLPTQLCKSTGIQNHMSKLQTFSKVAVLLTVLLNKDAKFYTIRSMPGICIYHSSLYVQ